MCSDAIDCFNIVTLLCKKLRAVSRAIISCIYIIYKSLLYETLFKIGAIYNGKYQWLVWDQKI